MNLSRFDVSENFPLCKRNRTITSMVITTIVGSVNMMGPMMMVVIESDSTNKSICLLVWRETFALMFF